MSALLDVIEAVYRVEEDEPAYVRGVFGAASRALQVEAGIAYPFDASNYGQLIPSPPYVQAVPEWVWKAFAESAAAGFDDAYLSHTFRRTLAAYGSQIPGSIPPHVPALLRSFGFADLFVVNGSDAAYRGMYLGVLVPIGKTVRTPAIWKQLAVHLATGARLQRKLGKRLDPSTADAVLSPSGKVLHAAREAEEKAARSDLREAVTRLETARGPRGKKDEAAAVDEWRALVSSRWSLVDHFESDGRRLVVAMENASRPAALSTLTARERQVVTYTAMGHSNKLTGYELGIATSTVGVLLHRAMKKLGVVKRGGLRDVVLPKAPKTDKS